MKSKKQYAVLQHTYLTRKSPTDTNEILTTLKNSGMPITARTYFRLKNEALEIVAKSLAIDSGLTLQHEMKERSRCYQHPK
jgi:hypothetical protein